jgi:copper chaperone CopZ
MCGAAAATTTTIKFRIRGMSTPNCPALVKAAVGRIKGVTRVDADLATRSATVEFVTGSTTAHAIQAVIKDQTGYEAEPIQ